MQLSYDEINKYHRCEDDPQLINSLDFLLFNKFSSILAICPSADKQITKLHHKDRSYKDSTETLLLTVMMTESCNFSCQYCNQGHDKQAIHISDQLIENIKSYISSLETPPKTIEINWFGGEPLIRSESIIRASMSIMEYCKSSSINYRSSIATNGYLLTQDLPLRLHESGLNFFQISIDGNKHDHDNSRFIKEGHSSYEVIMNNIEHSLNSSGARITIRVNVCEKNVHGLYELVDDLAQRGILKHKNFSIYFSHIYNPSLNSLGDDQGMTSHLLSPISFAKHQFEINNYVKSKHGKIQVDLPTYKGSCIASHKHSFAIHANGDLFKCYIPLSNKDESFGSLSSDGVVDFKKETFDRWNSWDPFTSPYCSGCKLLGSCRGACRFNFVSPDYQDEEFKCPPAKLYTNEYIFARAIASGIVDSADWDTKASVTDLSSLRFK